MICAGNKTAMKQTCRDDFGAPLTCKDPQSGIPKLIGLVSWAVGCGEIYPGVYAYVESVRSWITEKTGI